MGQTRVDEGSKAYLCHAEHTEVSATIGIAVDLMLHVDLLED